jgi:hypothetical protein
MKGDGEMASTVPNNRQGGRKPAQKYKSLLLAYMLLFQYQLLRTHSCLLVGLRFEINLAMVNYPKRP